jgi:hypothetical protein
MKATLKSVMQTEHLASQSLIANKNSMENANEIHENLFISDLNTQHQ